MSSEKPEEKHKFREKFMLALIEELIRNSYDEEKARKRMEEQQLMEVRSQLKSRFAMPMITPAIEEAQNPMNLPPLPKNQAHITRTHPLAPMQPEVTTAQSPIKLPQSIGTERGSVNLGKIARLLADPAVLSVECPGAGKNVLVNRSGVTQTTSIRLSEEEIAIIMDNISEQTRIPLVSGLFRAALRDLLVTAVVSDYVGTRFMIRKRTPFMQY